MDTNRAACSLRLMWACLTGCFEIRGSRNRRMCRSNWCVWSHADALQCLDHLRPLSHSRGPLEDGQRTLWCFDAPQRWQDERLYPPITCALTLGVLSCHVSRLLFPVSMHKRLCSSSMDSRSSQPRAVFRFVNREDVSDPIFDNSQAPHHASRAHRPATRHGREYRLRNFLFRSQVSVATEYCGPLVVSPTHNGAKKRQQARAVATSVYLCPFALCLAIVFSCCNKLSLQRLLHRLCVRSMLPFVITFFRSCGVNRPSVLGAGFPARL